jgi:hypothetical protein
VLSGSLHILSYIMAERSDSSGKCLILENAHYLLRRALTYCVDASERSPTTKPTTSRVEQIHTNERVPGHTNYYEKDGLRTYGDGEDHDHEPPMTFKRMMSLIAMAFRMHVLSLRYHGKHG